MSEIEAMFQEGKIPDFMELYDTGKLVAVGQGLPVSSPITPETPGWEKFTQEEINKILAVEGF